MLPDVRAARWLAVPLTGAVGAGAVVVVAQVRPQLAVQTGAVISALIAIGAAAVLLWPTDRPIDRPTDRTAFDRLAHRLFGLSILVWGAGQLLTAEAVAHGATFPTRGDRVSLLAAPVGLAGLLVMTRRDSRGIEWARLAIDALLLGLVSALLIWELGFEALSGHRPGAMPTLPLVLTLIAECALVALLLLMHLRDLDVALVYVMLGVALYCVGDLMTSHQLLTSARWPWFAAALWCLAWPAIAYGLVRYRAFAQPLGHDAERAEARVSAVTTATTLVLLVSATLTVLQHRRFEPVFLLMMALIIATFAAREVVVGLQRQALLRSLTALAYRDPLSQLGNRRALTRRLDAVAVGEEASVLTLDLDGFKEVNDVLGHSRGDALLAAVSSRLASALPPDVEAFRIGGDEFAVLVPGPAERGQQVAAELLFAARDAADDVPGARSVQVSASVGLASMSRSSTSQTPVSATDCPLAASVLGAVPAGQDALAALVESGVALRAAKAAGRDRVELYDGPVAARHRRGELVERRLRDAILSGDVVPHYQPVVDLGSRRVVGIEALARWSDPVLGTVTPDEFVPVAERSGLVVELGAAILHHAVHDLTTLWDAGHRLRLGVNASVVQLRRPGYAEGVLAVLGDAGVSSSELILEVTESLFVDVDDPAVRQLSTLRAAGAHVAIDDFGSGYSSLAYLSRMPADILKIDRELTMQVLHDRRSRAVLLSIVALAKSLPMDVVVEGVETADVHELVRDAGGEYGQGWLYGAAVPLEALGATIDAINARALLPLPR